MAQRLLSLVATKKVLPSTVLWGPPGCGKTTLARMLARAVGLPFVVSQAGVLQLTAVFPLFLVVEALVRWAPAGGRRAAAEVGLALAATFLTCGYYGLFAVLGIGTAALVLARRDWSSRARLVSVRILRGSPGRRGPGESGRVHGFCPSVSPPPPPG